MTFIPVRQDEDPRITRLQDEFKWFLNSSDMGPFDAHMIERMFEEGFTKIEIHQPNYIDLRFNPLEVDDDLPLPLPEELEKDPTICSVTVDRKGFVLAMNVGSDRPCIRGLVPKRPSLWTRFRAWWERRGQ